MPKACAGSSGRCSNRQEATASTKKGACGQFATQAVCRVLFWSGYSCAPSEAVATVCPAQRTPEAPFMSNSAERASAHPDTTVPHLQISPWLWDNITLPPASAALASKAGKSRLDKQTELPFHPCKLALPLNRSP